MKLIATIIVLIFLSMIETKQIHNWGALKRVSASNIPTKKPTVKKN
jgi:hypothetical protein